MSESITALKDQLESWKNRAKNIKVEAEGVADRGFNAGITLAGGGVVGLMRAKWGEGADKHVHIPGTEIDANLALAALALAAGVSGMAGKKSDLATSFGAGMGAALLCDVIEEKMTTGGAKKK